MGYKVKKDNNGKFYATCDKKNWIEVGEEVFLFLRRQNDKVWKAAHKNGKCATANFTLCDGECENCPFAREGFNMISYSAAFGGALEDDSDDSVEDIIADEHTRLIEDVVQDTILLEDLMVHLKEVTPDGDRIFQMLSDEMSEREITAALGIKAQSTTNYRVRKLKEFLSSHWDEYFG